MAKTTVELPDELLRQAKSLAVEQRTTLRALVERGLRAVVGRREPGGFTLRDGSVPGDGLRPEFRDAGWERVRDEIYDVERE